MHLYICIRLIAISGVFFEQLLPWLELVEANEHVKIDRYSRDVLQLPGGHVE